MRWLRVGTLAATVVNVAQSLSGNRGGKKATPMDFVPRFSLPGKKARSRAIRRNLMSTFGDRVKFKDSE